MDPENRRCNQWLLVNRVEVNNAKEAGKCTAS